MFRFSLRHLRRTFSTSWESNEEIQMFREYLRIPSVHPDVDYTDCVEFLKKQAQRLSLPVEVVYPVPKKPVVIMKWLGSNPKLPSIMLNSHMDVVPVYPEMWTHEPFSAHIDSEGRIFARGSQDMKSVGVQYLGAVRALQSEGFQPQRTVYITYAPDEEIGGELGMKQFVKTDDFRKMNVGFGLDEGVVSPDETYHVYNAERTAWILKFKFNGPSFHGSRLEPISAGQTFHHVIGKLMELRQRELASLQADPCLALGNVSSVNLTQISGGIQRNIVPPAFEAIVDIRVAITRDAEALLEQICTWCQELGGKVEVEYLMHNKHVGATKLDDSNPYWLAFKKTTDKLGLKIVPGILAGATDARFLRQLGIAAFGFTPINLTPILLHDHNEFVRADSFLSGIGIYKDLIQALASLGA